VASRQGAGLHVCSRGMSPVAPPYRTILPDVENGQIGWLRQELMSMDTTQRRAFVKFVTASVCMPVEANPIVVHPQVRLCDCWSMHDAPALLHVCGSGARSYC